MLALYRSERQADALRVYQTARKKLHDELGLEPCRALRELHHAILRDDGCLTLLAVS
jgi:DNA-binding SARP family transcriptional activator